MVRFGIIGTNWITEKLLDGGFQLDNFSLTAVYSRTEERAKEFAEKYQVENIFTDLEAMAASDSFDAIYIASPNSHHAKQSMLFMEHGKHVICEKPFASHEREAELMIACAQKNKVLLMEAMKTTFVPSFLSIKENLHKIGKVRRYVANYCQYSSRYDKYKEGIILNAFKPEFSNGSLMDIGIYCVYPMVALFGEPDKVQATGYMLESGVDGQGSILFTYKDMEAVVFHSKISNSFIPSEIQGENGTIIIDKISSPSKVEIHFNDGSIEDISKPQIENTMYYELKSFIELIESGKTESSINSYFNSRITARLLEAARKQVGIVFPADKVNE
ncbi:Gfo/Idh/MocA family oxidoreductase [Caldibacillus lycopersici]|uniref:Gfo/Idh/MocA family oxidoreductase n=1 Tax=Perspicuibacillus lycopersici TaxID=1325689 RepID=A0AAE3IV18_9BACI|nr:Gfo/Idh/MocA family oxidoreductase [Perspicuibacillus lycopersici]MCU9615113.1 Gfo/Idh/MocA family oxidoreductase [Perspicuibacillus lycopersici]